MQADSWDNCMQLCFDLQRCQQPVPTTANCLSDDSWHKLLTLRLSCRSYGVTQSCSLCKHKHGYMWKFRLQNSRVKPYARSYIYREACVHGGFVLRLIKHIKSAMKYPEDTCLLCHVGDNQSKRCSCRQWWCTFTLLSQSLPEPSSPRFPSEDSVM